MDYSSISSHHPPRLAGINGISDHITSLQDDIERGPRTELSKNIAISRLFRYLQDRDVENTLWSYPHFWEFRIMLIRVAQKILNEIDNRPYVDAQMEKIRNELKKDCIKILAIYEDCCCCCETCISCQ